MLHLIKLCVGVHDVEELRRWQTERLAALRAGGEVPELVHATRQTPREHAKLLAGGSLYWVIGGFIKARQQLVNIRPHADEGTPKCALVLGHELIEVSPKPQRPFQGWRYLKPENAPADLAKQIGGTDMPPEMREELAALGLL
jgi:hypothetical protein